MLKQKEYYGAILALGSVSLSYKVTNFVEDLPRAFGA